MDNEILQILLLANLTAAAIPVIRRPRDAGRDLQASGGEFFSAESIAVAIALVVGIDRNTSRDAR